MSIAIVNQSPSAIASGGSSSKTVTISSTTAGNTLALVFAHTSSALSISSISGAGTWSKLIRNADPTFLTDAEIWVCPNISAGVTTITITISATYGPSAVTVVELSGMPTAFVQDPSTGSGQLGVGKTAATPSATPTAGKSLILFAVVCVKGGDTITNTPSGSWSALTVPSGQTYTAFAYLIISSASGSYSTSFSTQNNYVRWNAVIAGLDGANANPWLFLQDPELSSMIQMGM